jgi:hypothetical protein
MTRPPPVSNPRSRRDTDKDGFTIAKELDAEVVRGHQPHR